MKGISESDLERLLADEVFLDRLADRVAKKVAALQAQQSAKMARQINALFTDACDRLNARQ
ncbi:MULTISPECIES: hypothetical protein [unclassified Pseudomonas]|uniref:hypothetical protein n=1 Tax=unclassified Pseudomonas TaxID=196821 RepID=UPI000A933EB4|nr:MULTISPECIES: hypothetical protein [unclassified Pseudomonas]MED5607779.1 hypothetical protein [Pseudomonas sp. JH-2]